MGGRLFGCILQNSLRFAISNCIFSSCFAFSVKQQLHLTNSLAEFSVYFPLDDIVALYPALLPLYLSHVATAYTSMAACLILLVWCRHKPHNLCKHTRDMIRFIALWCRNNSVSGVKPSDSNYDNDINWLETCTTSTMVYIQFIPVMANLATEHIQL